jgi:pilus assembly protein CpaF
MVVQASRMNDGTRKVVSLHEITGMEGEIITSQEIFFFERQGMSAQGQVLGRFRASGVRPHLADRLSAFGIELPPDLFDPEPGDNDAELAQPR